MKPDKNVSIDDIIQKEYAFGFRTEVEPELTFKGLSEETVRKISARKNEPQFVLDFRLKALSHWRKSVEPTWARLKYPPIDYDGIICYSEPRKSQGPEGGGVAPELVEAFDKLGIPIAEGRQMDRVAVDAIFDSVSVATTHQELLRKEGVIFCAFSEAARLYPDLVQKYLGSVVPPTDNFFASLNSAVFSDGTFVYVPKGVRCPMDLSSYFRINTRSSGQFERTLIICEEGASVSYLEGCTAPKFDENQLHAAVVELGALDDAHIKYSTVQNWYAGDPETGRGGIFNFVTKRGHCRGARSRISWTQVETGSAITWKYPSCVLWGENSVGEFYSVALTNHHQQADTGSKMIHIGAGSRSTIISKGISAGESTNTYRGLVQIQPTARKARNFTQCDSVLVGSRAKANTFPTTDVHNADSRLEHEASTSRISEEQLLYFRQRGISPEEAVRSIIGGFCSRVFKELPPEFAVEATQLLGVKLEGSVG
ncbi:MAG: Fe-S cluster assembly protein SufB [Candidatus Omnitrophica bacterium]|nr:Fe-S cluster assembly protein SufB [Candidatus Omnitrophota bacterium]